MIFTLMLDIENPKHRKQILIPLAGIRSGLEVLGNGNWLPSSRHCVGS